MPFAETFSGRYDAAVVGTGFSSSFFLQGFLARAPRDARVIVLERGSKTGGSSQAENRSAASAYGASGSGDDVFYRKSGDVSKNWMFTLGFGGGSQCWWGNTPRFLPADFETKSRFGVGRDWPIGYGDLAPYYDRVETAMSVAGAAGPWPFPKSGPYPQPPHKLGNAERLLKAAYPASFFNVPTARARVSVPGRNVCCANGVCHACPVDAKFTIKNGLMSVYEDPRVTVLPDAAVVGVDVANRTAKSVVIQHDGAQKRVAADLVVLGANALFNPFILQRSSLNHPVLGKGLHEQVGVLAEVFLDGVDSFGGSTSVTGHSYLLYDDEDRRRQMAACLIETWNVGRLRSEPGRWRQVLPLRLVFDNLPDDRNYVGFDEGDPSRPVMHYAGHSDYTTRAIARVEEDLARVMAPLPVEKIVVRPQPEATEAHILGTTRMGNDPRTSIVDRNSVHHEVHNLLVLGSGTFPTGGPSNPTLTLSALALRAGEMLMA